MLPGMLESKKLTLRASEIRTRLSEIAALPDDGMNDEIRTESGHSSRTEYREHRDAHARPL